MVGYGTVWILKGYMPHKYPMIFLTLNKTFTTIFLLTLINTTKLYPWCSARVEKEDIQVIVKKMGSVWRMCQDIGNISNLWMVRCMP
jgi:hypothetical protein